MSHPRRSKQKKAQRYRPKDLDRVVVALLRDSGKMATLGGSFGNTAPLKKHKGKGRPKYVVPGAGSYNHIDTASFKFKKVGGSSFGGKMAKMDRGATGYLSAAHKFRAPVRALAQFSLSSGPCLISFALLVALGRVLAHTTPRAALRARSLR